MQSIKEYDQRTINAVARTACKASLMFHTRYFFKAQYKRKFIIGEHHKIICEALERVYKGECKRLIIEVAPRFGKTELAVKSFISNGLAINPSAKFIHLSYSDDLALDNSETIKDLVVSEDYQDLFPEVRIKKDAKAKNKWYTTAGGGMLARSAGGSVTGFGAGHVDKEDGEDEDIDSFLAELGKDGFNGAIVIDDPVKPEDADSETKRERVNQRFDSTIRTRTNSRNTPIIVIMQRTHPNDLAGYLQRKDESDKWEVISLPVINKDGTALWPHKMTIEEAEKLKHANEIVFERQYMQNPAPKTGLMFPSKELNYFSDFDLSNPDHNYICADPANEGGDDFAAIDGRLIGTKIYIHSVIYNTNGTDHNEPAVVEMVKDSKCTNVGIEGVMGWVETAVRIRTSLQEKGFAGEVRVLRPRTGKHARISNRQSFIRNNFVFREDWESYPEYAKFMRCLTTYLKIQEPGRRNKNDDAPDVCEMMAAYFEKNFPELWALT